MLTTPTPRKFFNLFAKLLLLLAFSWPYLATAQTANVDPPTGGFKVDGQLRVNSSVGDWWPRATPAAGDGGYIFGPTYVTPTDNNDSKKWIREEYNSTADDIFSEGSKFNGDPSGYKWTNSKATGKNDIHNGLFYITTGVSSNTDRWLLLGGDRLSITGTSYIDFEFLQKKVVMKKDGSGEFTTEGTDGGRTEGDFVVSMEYSGGGSKPNVYVYFWRNTNKGWQYVKETVNAADAFAETNRTGTVDAPYTGGAFGSNTYLQYAFVEAAVNITKILELQNGTCNTTVIETIFIKTKASDAAEAALKDFIEPQNVKLVFGGSSIEYGGPYCKTGTASPSFGGISVGTFAAFESDGITSAGSNLVIDQTTGIINLANSMPGTYVIKFTFTSLGCTQTVQDEIEIKAPPTITLGTISPYCRTTETGDRNMALTYSATANSPTQYKITFDDASLTGKNVDWTNLPHPTAGTINIPVPKNLAAGNYSFKLKVRTAAPSGTLAGCESGEYTVNFAIKAATVFSINESGGNCPGASKTFTYSYTSGASASTYAWFIVGNSTSIGSGSSVNYTNPATCGSYTVKLDVTNSDGCTSSQEKLVNVVDAVAPEFTSFDWESSISCGTTIPDPTTNKPGATDNCGTPSVTLQSNTSIDVGACGNKVIKRVWKAMDACGNYVTREQIIFVTDETAPALTCPADVSVDNLSQATAVATAIDGCSSGTDVKVFSIDIPNGSNSIKRRWWAIDASGNKSAYCDQIITINTPAPQTQISNQRTVSSEMKAPAPAVKKQMLLKAYPNPYNNKVNFSFTANKSGYAVLDLVDLNGRKVATVFKGNVIEGQSKTVSYESNTGTKVPLVYRLTIGNEIKSGKILPMNN